MKRNLYLRLFLFIRSCLSHRLLASADYKRFTDKINFYRTQVSDMYLAHELKDMQIRELIDQIKDYQKQIANNEMKVVGSNLYSKQGRSYAKAG